MYTIRADAQQETLCIELSGRIRTEEALRAASQAAALLEAGALESVFCDMRAATRGPGGLLVVAASIAAAHRPGMRVAFLAGDGQARTAARLCRFAGLQEAGQVFASEAAAIAWLRPRRAQQLDVTARRHAWEALGFEQPTKGVGRRRPEPRTPAA
ncbi:MAG: hypothetical protein IT304_09480 [Dehalococcoidia bacterium]|nr:hypothetical protein [Dehalococcoidia bacterium]